MTRARDLSNFIGSGSFSSTTFTATAGQTVFTIAHTQGFIQVFMNGLLLDETVDYTSNGSAITLTTAAVAGDEIEVVKYDAFSVGDAIRASGGTFTGSIDASAGLTTPAGHVIQSAFTINNLITSNTSTSYSDLLSLSFTPKFNNSMLFIISTIRYQEATSNNDIKVKITHDGTAIWEANRYFNYSGDSNLIQTSTIQAFVSSTGSTSARDIKVQVGQYTTGTSYFNTNTGTSGDECSLSIQEIAQ